MLRSLRRRLAAILTRSRFEAEMREELRSHLEHRIDDLAASGLWRRAQLPSRAEEF